MAIQAKRKSGRSRKPSGGAKPRPLRDLSPAYRARLKTYAKREGITVAELRKRGSGAARGHAAPPGKTEAQIRREHQAAKIDAFARVQAEKWHGVDADKVAAEIAAALHAQVKVHGMRWLARLQAELAGLNRDYMAQDARDKKGRRPSLGISLDDLEEHYELPRETFAYH